MSAPTLTAADAVALDPEARAYYAGKRREQWRRRVLPAAGLIGLVFVWFALVAVFDVKPFIAPSPQLVLSTMVAKWSILWSNLLPTALEALGGFLVGNLCAILLATLFIHNKAVQEAFFPIAVMINTIPVVAKAPILVLLLGNGMEPKIAIAALICFFPTLVNMTRGLRDVSPEQLELMRILSASQREVFWKLRVQNSLPYLFSALKIAASTAVIGAIVGEWIGSNEGIGALIIQATYSFDSPLLYATIVVGSTFSALFFALISWLERRTIRWNVGRAP